MAYVYIYFDTRKRPPEAIYVGKGTGYRAECHLNPKLKTTNKLLKRKIKKIKDLGLEPYIIKVIDNITDEKAFEIEKNFIKKYGKIFNKTGSLCNFTDGGEGMSGWIGGKRSKELCAKIGALKIGIKLSEAHKNKLSNSCKGKRIILQFSLCGKFIKEWESISECHRATGFKISNISRCCSLKLERYKGFVWKFK